jgi:hypothetical protein
MARAEISGNRTFALEDGIGADDDVGTSAIATPIASDRATLSVLGALPQAATTATETARHATRRAQHPRECVMRRS